MQVYYAARANEYDKVYLKPERQANLREIEQWLPKYFTGCNVLEVAAGTGYWTQFLAKESQSIVAIDAVQETLDIAQQRISATHVNFSQADAYDLSSLPYDFDAAFAGFWLSHVPKQVLPQFIEQLNHSLKPRSKVLFLDNLFVHGSSSDIVHTDEFGNTYQNRKLVDGTQHQIIKNFLSEEELRDTLQLKGDQLVYHKWDYFWALEYVSK